MATEEATDVEDGGEEVVITDEESDGQMMQEGEEPWDDDGSWEEDLDNRYRYAIEMGFAAQDWGTTTQRDSQESRREAKRRRDQFEIDARTRPPMTKKQQARIQREKEVEASKNGAHKQIHKQAKFEKNRIQRRIDRMCWGTPAGAATGDVKQTRKARINNKDRTTRQDVVERERTTIDLTTNTDGGRGNKVRHIRRALTDEVVWTEEVGEEDRCVVEVTRTQLQDLEIRGTVVSDVLLDALQRKCLPNGNIGRAMVTHVDLMRSMQRIKVEDIADDRVKRMLGRRRIVRITEATRLLMPLITGGHFSLLDLDLKYNTVQHHDSTKTHAQDIRWRQKTQKLGKEIRKQRGWRDTHIKIREPRRDLQTQSAGTAKHMHDAYMELYENYCAKRGTTTTNR